MIRMGYLTAKVMYNAIPYMIQYRYRVIAYTYMHRCSLYYKISMTELVVIYTYIIPYRVYIIYTV